MNNYTNYWLLPEIFEKRIKNQKQCYSLILLQNTYKCTMTSGPIKN